MGHAESWEGGWGREDTALYRLIGIVSRKSKKTVLFKDCERKILKQHLLGPG
jgi:hypothetical protein